MSSLPPSACESGEMFIEMKSDEGFHKLPKNSQFACEDKTFIEVKNVHEDMQHRKLKHSRSKSAEFSAISEQMWSSGHSRHSTECFETPDNIYSIMSSTSTDCRSCRSCPWTHTFDPAEFMWTEVYNTFQELGFTNSDMMQEVMENIPDWPRQNGVVFAAHELVIGNDHHKQLMKQAIQTFRIQQRAEQVMSIVNRNWHSLSDEELAEMSPEQGAELRNTRAEIDSTPELKAAVEKLIAQEVYLSFLRENPAKMSGIIRTITREENPQLINHSKETMDEAIKIFQDMDTEWMRFQEFGATKSKGSLNHPHGCQACMFYMYSAKGCREGFDCEYCHGEHISNRAHKKMVFREQIQKKKRERAAQREHENS